MGAGNRPFRVLTLLDSDPCYMQQTGERRRWRRRDCVLVCLHGEREEDVVVECACMCGAVRALIVVCAWWCVCLCCDVRVCVGARSVYFNVNDINCVDVEAAVVIPWPLSARPPQSL